MLTIAAMFTYPDMAYLYRPGGAVGSKAWFKNFNMDTMPDPWHETGCDGTRGMSAVPQLQTRSHTARAAGSLLLGGGV